MSLVHCNVENSPLLSDFKPPSASLAWINDPQYVLPNSFWNNGNYDIKMDKYKERYKICNMICIEAVEGLGTT